MRFNKTILTINEISFQVLMEKLEENPDLIWRWRRKNKGDCVIEEGYWFPGGKHYAAINFWEDESGKSTTKHIALNISDKKESILKLNAYNDPKLETFYRTLMQNIPGFQQVGSKKVWQKVYEGSFFRRTLERFIENEKPLIDELIREHQPPHITFIDPEVFQENKEKMIALRENLKAEKAEEKTPRQSFEAALL
ncbi:MAG: hypothetical protein ACOCZ8_02385 [Bacteroidota bacterium]